MEDSLRRRMIVALDFHTFEEAKALVTLLGDDVLVYKVGLEIFLVTGGKIIDFLKEQGKEVFLDLKFHDIKNTVLSATKYALEQELLLYNIHAANGFDTMQAVAAQARESGTSAKAIAVTILTSLDDSDMERMFPEKGVRVEAQILQFGALAKEAGMHGIVCSPREARTVKDMLGTDFLTICPGVRPSFANKGDQKRVMTPREALENGVDYFVIGRPITQASDPKEATRLVLLEMETAKLEQ